MLLTLAGSTSPTYRIWARRGCCYCLFVCLFVYGIVDVVFVVAAVVVIVVGAVEYQHSMA